MARGHAVHQGYEQRHNIFHGAMEFYLLFPAETAGGEKGNRPTTSWPKGRAHKNYGGFSGPLSGWQIIPIAFLKDPTPWVSAIFVIGVLS